MTNVITRLVNGTFHKLDELELQSGKPSGMWRYRRCLVVDMWNTVQITPPERRWLVVNQVTPISGFMYGHPKNWPAPTRGGHRHFRTLLEACEAIDWLADRE